MLIQVLVAIIATFVHFWSNMGAGAKCDGSCDYAAADRASILFMAVVLGSFALSIAAIVITFVRRIPLAGVPILGCVLIVLALIISDAFVHGATG